MSVQHQRDHEVLMPPTRHYQNAPINEAVLDLQVTLPEGTTAETFAAIRDRVHDDYPGSERNIVGSIHVQAGTPVQVQTAQAPNGYIFRSQDGLQSFRATTTAFTFNRLRPYSSWEVFRDEARRLWGIYRDVCKPLTVTRVALRYINRLDLPSTLRDFKDFLRTVPEVPSELDKGLNGFFMQLQLPQYDLESMLIINEALAPPSNPGTVAVILDIDVARQYVWQSDDEDIWHYLERLRTRKNQAFEASITDATRKLFD